MRSVGNLLFWGSGAVMLLFELYWFTQWWGTGGLLLAVFAPPVAAIFPFIYLVMEGFSALYFGVWAAGLVGAFLGRDEAA
jgi:hypothetical protein